MAAITFPDLVDDRADALQSHGLDGLKLALVSLPPGPNPDHADIDLRFFNGLHLAAILADIGGDPVRARQVLRIRGGSRIVAGNASGQVQVTAVTGIDATRLSLRIAPVGDYSTYRLDLVWNASLIDPFFSSIGFKFRPGCFTNDCAPPQPGRPAAPNPAIDYLAKDYDSFRHTLMVAMAERVPGWASTSEADHDQVLIDLFAAAADELSDFQDRVMVEAYLASARKRVSLVRHARLVDYHVHEGNQASTWLALDVVAGQAPFTLDDQELVAWTGSDPAQDNAVFFASRQRRLLPAQRQRLDPLLNRLRLHTWRNAQPALAAGSTSADIALPSGLASQVEADALRDLVRNGLWREMLIAEELNPLTGAKAGRRRAKRQLLRLLPGNQSDRGAAESIFDPVTNTWIVRVHWREEDALRFDYSFTTFCPGPPPVSVENVSLFYGNLVTVHQGRPLQVHFHEPGTLLPSDTETVKHRHYQRLDRYGNGRDWVLAELPDEGPLAFLPPRHGTAPTGEEPARSTLWLEVESPGAARETWDEVESLVHSDDSAENGDHYMVETDEQRRSVLRFGNGGNGRLLPNDAQVHAEYQVGGGHTGNIGADQLVNVQPLTGALGAAIVAATNPFDVTDGRDPEPLERIRRNAPEAFRARQLRAVTLADYVQRAEEVPGVARAVARYAWTGSWRTVRIAIDPLGFTALGDERSDALWAELRPRIADHLEAVRLIGEDLELRPPRYVPLEIRVVVCAAEAYWREDLRFVLEQEFSNGWTSDGRRGFFHPDQWTFGQALHRSLIEGRIQAIAGIEHGVSISMKRFSAPQPGVPGAEVLEIGFDEVLLLANDPDHLERGLIRFDVQGGRR
ncbi:putative baseplate assembly protein [Pseudomonas sp. LAMO17WK12:I10]|uniref:baseplate J/gp47 family protein n=1 Tax=unclassified Pseudomonas TaxID=196821 RepID=UPI000BD7F640|nr:MULTISPECIES: baseplate J/gp47 family protein [unclassified Pseudomonas]PXX69508.1 putative phage baseplate assembly protein [Pseudomonas sp. LAMO17WK12:I9]SNY32915.1 putative baseplate assembly protein [Pseudomonas sp. LAMO17WK12:I10]